MFQWHMANSHLYLLRRDIGLWYIDCTKELLVTTIGQLHKQYNSLIQQHLHTGLLHI
jgi:hypothetical protein